MTETTRFKKFADVYDIRVNSSDGLGTDIHDTAIVKALNSKYSVSNEIASSADKTLFVGRLHCETKEVIFISFTYRK